MGYDVHITRAEEWLDSEASPITLDEWMAYVASDSEMRHDGYAEATTGAGETLRIEGDGISVWTAYSRDGEGGGHAWFCWNKGRIVVKNPDKEILGKMTAIASALGASVQGDEFEHYECLEHHDNPIWKNPAHEPLLQTPTKKPWWKRLFGG